MYKLHIYMKLKWWFAWIEGYEADLGILTKENFFFCYILLQKKTTGVLEFSKYIENAISVSV